MTAPTRPSRSHSQLNNYLHCGHAYYLTKIRRLAERPSVWLPGGKAFHTATEQFDLATWTDTCADDWDVEPWLNVLDEAFDVELAELRESEPDETRWRTAGRKTKEKPNGEDVTWWREAGRGFVRDYITWRTNSISLLEIAVTPDGGPAIELEVTLTLGGVPMRGYVDRVLRDRDTGGLLVVDLKTGSRTPDSPLQLALYSVQLEPVLGEPVVWGAFYDARKGVLADPINLRQWNTDNLGSIYSMLDKGIQAGVFLPNISSMCRSCGIREHCIYTGGRDPGPA